MNLRESILASSDFQIVPVQVTEKWGGTLYVRQLSSLEREELEVLWEENEREPFKHRNLKARVLVLAVCDKDGNTIFKREDADAVGNKPAALLDKLFEAVIKLNRLSQAELEESAKNS